MPAQRNNHRRVPFEGHQVRLYIRDPDASRRPDPKQPDARGRNDSSSLCRLRGKSVPNSIYYLREITSRFSTVTSHAVGNHSGGMMSAPRGAKI
jgi:hypothetical protein